MILAAEFRSGCQDGTSLVIHAGKDDYQSDPAGNSGDHIACGMITGAAPTVGHRGSRTQ